MDNTLLSKMIGIVVAVIVAAVVLVPICNSLTEGDGGSGGGGEGDTTDYVVLNDLETMYGEIDVSVPFKTLQSYIFLETPIVDPYSNLSKSINELDLTLDMNFIEQISAVENVGASLSQNLYLLNLWAYHEDDSGFSFAIYLSNSHGTPDTSNKLMFYIDKEPAQQYGFVEDISAFLLTAHNGVITLSVDGYTTDETFIEIRESVHIQDTSVVDLVYVSDDEVGWVGGDIYADGADGLEEPYPDLMVGSVFQTSILSIDYDMAGVEGFAETYPLIKVENIQNNTLKGTVNVNAVSEEGFIIQDKYFIVEYEIPLIETSNGVYRFVNDEEASTTWTIIGNVGLDGAEYTDANLGHTYLWSGDGFVSSINANPVEISESGGGSSGNGDLGVAGTIIGIIPVFVILAILMGAVGLFYQNRNNPGL